jgi:Cupin-like domain
VIETLDAETRTWIVNQLLHGRDPGRVADRLATLGVARRTAEAAVRDAGEDEYLRAARVHVARTRKMEGLLDAYARMWNRSAEARSLAEVDALDEETFREEFYYRNRPVLVRRGAAHWPAVARWTPAAFKARFGSVPIEYMAGSNRYRRAKDVQRRTTVGAFVDRVEATRASNEFYVVATNLTFRRSADLLPLSEDLRPLAFAPQIDFTDPAVVNLWFGPRGTVTPLHHDVMNVLFAQVHGRKDFILAPAFSVAGLYNRYGVYSDVDPAALDLRRFPDAARVRWLRARVGPGDVLFIPVGWWHWVYAVDTSISISLADFTVEGVLDRLGSLRGDIELAPDAVPARFAGDDLGAVAAQVPA